MRSPTRRDALAAALLSAVAGAPMVAEAMAGPDADLIRACSEHVEARRAFNAGGGAPDSPLEERYLRAFRAVDDGPTPRSMAGVLALAKSALAEAGSKRDGKWDWGDDAAAFWAGDAVVALLQLSGCPEASA